MMSRASRNSRRTDPSADVIRQLIREEVRMIVEGRRGNVQSEPEFGALLDAFRLLEGKGFGAGEISTALSEYTRKA
jgi:hypothetical protein